MNFLGKVFWKLNRASIKQASKSSLNLQPTLWVHYAGSVLLRMSTRLLLFLHSRHLSFYFQAVSGLAIGFVSNNTFSVHKYNNFITIRFISKYNNLFTYIPFPNDHNFPPLKISIYFFLINQSNILSFNFT